MRVGQLTAGYELVKGMRNISGVEHMPPLTQGGFSVEYKGVEISLLFLQLESAR
jgi:hypothetical protein